VGWTDNEVVDLLIKIIIEGRGGGPISPTDDQFGIGGKALSRNSSRTHSTASKKKGSRAFTAAQIRSVAPKKKRKVSAYQREFGRQMKILIKAHPRTPRTKLMQRAHRATKKARK
jgi:hypothetical protein